MFWQAAPALQRRCPGSVRPHRAPPARRSRRADRGFPAGLAPLNGLPQRKTHSARPL